MSTFVPFTVISATLPSEAPSSSILIPSNLRIEAFFDSVTSEPNLSLIVLLSSETISYVFDPRSKSPEITDTVPAFVNLNPLLSFNVISSLSSIVPAVTSSRRIGLISVIPVKSVVSSIVATVPPSTDLANVNVSADTVDCLGSIVTVAFSPVILAPLRVILKPPSLAAAPPAASIVTKALVEDNFSTVALLSPSAVVKSFEASVTFVILLDESASYISTSSTSSHSAPSSTSSKLNFSALISPLSFMITTCGASVRTSSFSTVTTFEILLSVEAKAETGTKLSVIAAAKAKEINFFIFFLLLLN